MSSAIAALVRGKHDVGVGVVLGSNVFNLAAMIGLTAILCRRIQVRRQSVAFEGAAGIAATLIVGALILKLLGPWVTLALLAAVLIPYLALLGRFGEHHRPDHALVPGERVFVPALMLLPALAIIIVGSTGMVDSALRLAHRWSVPDVIVGIVVLAILTSLPNALTAARLGLQGRGSALVSETLNSNTVNLVFGVAIPAFFVTIASTSALTGFDLGWLLLMTVLALALLARRAGVGRSGGAAILLDELPCLVVAAGGA